MKSSARRHSRKGALTGLLGEAASAAGFAISRNPILVGGTTAFLITVFYVSANALWGQPYFHSSAFVATRAVIPPIARPVEDDRQPASAPIPARSVPVTRISLPQGQDAPAPAPQPTASDTMRTDAIPAPAGDEKIRRIQAALGELNLYSGEVDGLNGPKTRAAIQNYQRIVGVEATGEASPRLLEMLSERVPAIAAPPTPAPAERTAALAPAPAARQGDATIARVQAGLRAFGNEGIEIDGKLGARTREALKEFQGLFGLPVTGEPDQQSIAKMREIGLTD